MTVEEAISRFKDEINGEGFYNDNAHREMAVEALKKQIPKKPCKEDVYGDIDCLCPDCGFVVIEEYDDFCGNCGQKIDWSDE